MAAGVHAARTYEHLVLQPAKQLRDACRNPRLQHLEIYLPHVHLCAEAATLGLAAWCSPALRRRTLLSSSGGYFGSVCFFGGPSAIAFLEKGCREAACCAIATEAYALAQSATDAQHAQHSAAAGWDRAGKCACAVPRHVRTS